MRFIWRLETVLKAKLRAEEQRQQDLAEALRKLREEEAERARIAKLQADCREALKRLQTGQLNPRDLSQINTYLEALHDQHEEIETRIKNAQNAVERAREALTRAVRERQTLENLKARDYQAFKTAEKKRDQTLMDELAARRKLED